jgi:extracellular matrix regulatory protein A
MSTELVHVGFGNILAMDKVLAIVSPTSAPIKRTMQAAKNKGLLIDLTSGRKTKAVIIMDSGHIVLAALNPETIASRVAASRGGGVKLD